MSFMKRAQEAAAQVAAMGNHTANDPQTQEQISRSAEVPAAGAVAESDAMPPSSVSTG